MLECKTTAVRRTKQYLNLVKLERPDQISLTDANSSEQLNLAKPQLKANFC